MNQQQLVGCLLSHAAFALRALHLWEIVMSNIQISLLPNERRRVPQKIWLHFISKRNKILSMAQKNNCPEHTLHLFFFPQRNAFSKHHTSSHLTAFFFFFSRQNRAPPRQGSFFYSDAVCQSSNSSSDSSIFWSRCNAFSIPLDFF